MKTFLDSLLKATGQMVLPLPRGEGQGEGGIISPRIRFRPKWLALLTLILCLLSSAKAADYAVQKTFWAFTGTWTNTPTIATNLASTVDTTVITDFSLQLLAYGTNNQGGAGSFDAFWETSLDGVNWPQTTNIIGRTCGWFSIPIQSNAVQTVWTTNITVDAIGYWRLRWLTNQANMCYTNIQLRAYAKPKRQNRDY